MHAFARDSYVTGTMPETSEPARADELLDALKAIQKRIAHYRSVAEHGSDGCDSERLRHA